MDIERLRGTLASIYNSKYVDSLLLHYQGAIDGFNIENWDTALSKSGKFIEATLKALFDHTGNEVPVDHKFNVNKTIQQLENTDSCTDRSIRTTVPRACRFVYEISSNRGARHDSDKFVPNRMDANVVIPIVSWILAEMIRLANEVSSNEDRIGSVVLRLTENRHPVFESIEDRTYVNHTGLSPREIAILLLYERFPDRIKRKDLAALVKLNKGDATKNSISVALTRLRNQVDVNDAGWVLRHVGIDEAEQIISSHCNGQFT